MKRHVVLSAALVLAPMSSSWAAQLNAPAALPGAANPAALAGGNNVTVSNKCCSIWDFLGVNQVGKFLNNNLFQTRLGQAVATALGPVGRALGLGPALTNDVFAKEGGAMGLANKLKKEEKKVPLKVQAIRYLGTLDCNCYPEVVDALLASLDDCSEVVRYEALVALHSRCQSNARCKTRKYCKIDNGHFSHLKGLAHHKSCEGGVCLKDGCDGTECTSCECHGCQCQKKVMDKLNELLLERDENGCLKEKCEKIRALATQMIEECLSLRQPPPGVDAPATTPEGAKPRLDERPKPAAKETGARVPTARTAPVVADAAPTPSVDAPKSMWRNWFKRNSEAASMETVGAREPAAAPAERVETIVPDALGGTVIATPSTRWTGWFRPKNAGGTMIAEPIVDGAARPTSPERTSGVEHTVAKPVPAEPTGTVTDRQYVTPKSSDGRHLWGELFGY